MKKIRLGNDIKFNWSLLNSEGELYNIEGADLRITYTTFRGVTEVTDFSVSGNVVSWVFRGKDQKVLGDYIITLQKNAGEDGMITIDKCSAFRLVARSCDAGGETACSHLKVETVELQSEVDGVIVDPVIPEIGENGNWFVNGKDTGKPSKGEDGKAFTYADFTPEQIEELQKPATDAADSLLRLEKAIESAEQSRILAENNRNESELLREQSELVREQAETERSSAETKREENESKRLTAEQARIQAESARSVAEQDRVSKEQSRVSAEEDRVADETKRSEAESQRAQAETKRAEAETARVLAETKRSEAEASRISAEIARVSAEETRVTEFEQLKQDSQTAIDNANKSVLNANEAITNVNAAAEAVDGRIKNIETQIDNMEQEGNALTSDVSDGKALIAEAITNKGVLTSPTDSFVKMAENIGQIYRGAYDEFLTVKINDDLPSPEVIREGSAAFPNWLEDNIQNVMLKDGVINYYLDRNDSRKKSNGLPAVTDGTDGDIMIILPKFWYSIVHTAEGVEITYSSVAQTTEGWIESPEIYVGSSEGVIETVDGKDYLRSCFNMSAEFRGGDNQASWDDLPKSLLGMPRTSKNHDAFRLACVNKLNIGAGKYHQFDYRSYHKILLMFMAVYGTRNIQDGYAGINYETGDGLRNEEGFKYGGLGKGVSDCGSWWNTFNNQRPFIHTDVSYELGCRSGVVDYAVNIGTEEVPVVQTVPVPVLWGIANPYGHIYHAMDGVTKQVLEINGAKYDRWALFHDPDNYKSSGQNDADKVVDIPQVNSGYIKKMQNDLLPTMTGGTEATYWTDYLYSSSNLNNYAVFHGGYASYGGSCGLAYVNSVSGVGYASANYGGRLCFSPS